MKLSKDWLISIGLPLVACVLLYAGLSPTENGSIDLLGLWLGTDLSYKGENPYNWNRLVIEKNVIDSSLPLPWPLWNPPWTFTLLRPLITTDFSTAVSWWFLFSLIVIGVLLFCGLRMGKGFSPFSKVATTIYLITFPSLLSHLLTGHFLILLTAALLAGVFLLSKNQRGWAGFILSLTLLKPNLFLFFYAGLCADCLHRKDLRFPLGAAAGVSFLIAITWLVNNELFTYYWSIFPGPSEWRTFPLAPLSLMLDDSIMRVVKHVPWIIVGIVGVIKARPLRSSEEILLLYIPLSLLLAPHAHPYDFVVLLPSIFLSALIGFTRASKRESAPILALLILLNLLIVNTEFEYFISYLYLAVICLGIPLLYRAISAREKKLFSEYGA